MEVFATEGGRFCEEDTREEDVAEDEDEPAIGGESGDRGWFEGIGELRREIEESLSRTYSVCTVLKDECVGENEPQ